MKPNLDVLPEAQKKVWPLLEEIPKDFVLHGGTAVALYYGHRWSIDFDFFTTDRHIDLYKTAKDLSFIKEYSEDSRKYDKTHFDFTLRIDKDLPSENTVKISFISTPETSPGLFKKPGIAEDIGIQIASPLDLLCGKIRAMHTRKEAKDYIDTATLLEHGISLTQGFAGMVVYAQHNKEVASTINLEGLMQELQNSKIIASRISNCGDEELASKARSTATTLADFVKKIDLKQVESLAKTLKLKAA